METLPQYSGGDFYDSSQCPPSFTTPKLQNASLYGNSSDDNMLGWSYDGTTGYDFTSQPLPHPSSAFNPSVSVVSCSPRSDASGVSLSPQPNMYEYANAFNFNDYTSPLPTQFSNSPSSSSTWSQTHRLSIDQSRRTSMSHSPSTSCSSLEVFETKPMISSSSRSGSPSKPEVDPQQQRRRFPCVIIGCERRFTSQYTLKVHMEAHKPKPRSSFPCTLGCSERFSRQHDRLRHEVAKHGKVCEFLCDDCGRFFSTQKTLGNHKCPVAQGGTRWVSN
ncbi:hypothetical protein CPC08DRAFT_713079 [Agrocybe pediades]|nr:hypothetical protein CPC08DRAFT_713079 [Agrocybe pediades]